LQGAGDAFTQTACFSLITIEFSEDQETYLGWAEAATGLGLAIGPTLGSLVYTEVGYEWTFILFGIVLFLGAILTYFVLPNALNTGYKEEPRKNSIVSRGQRIHSVYGIYNRLSKRNDLYKPIDGENSGER
jgi:MFS family permease